MVNRATSDRSGTVETFTAVVGPWSQGTGPLFRRLARSIASAVERGALPDGSRLPSEREAARVLSIGRGTAVAAYDVLVAEGLVERRRGSGSFVRVSDQPPLPPGREGSALVHRLVEAGTPAGALVDLSISVPRDAGALSGMTLGPSDIASVVPETGYSPQGLSSLRRAIADHVTDLGLATDEDQIVVTSGAQQAISMAAACWVRPGDTVVVDDPTYPGALAAFLQAGARIVGAPVDADGISVDGVAALLDAHPSLLYLQTGPHSPTGSILPARRRHRIAELAVERHVPVVEDMALGGLAWADMPAPLAAVAPTASIAVVGSLSKLFWGGLRVGFVRAPEPLALRFARIKATRDLGTSAVSQVLAERLLASTPPATFRTRAGGLEERCAVLTDALADRLPTWRWRRPSGGLSLWVDIGVAGERFAQAALRNGVAVATPAALSPSRRWDDHVRLSFAADVDELIEGVERLAATWESGR